VGNGGDTQHTTTHLRTYGEAPFRVVVLHGGPGALGSMSPVARVLGAEWGVLEPLLSAFSVEGQVEELRSLLERSSADMPVTLIGSSWGAMLGFIFAARYSGLVGKLLLVGSGPFEARYAEGIDQIRWNRLSDEERRQRQELLVALEDPAVADKNAVFAQLGALSTRTDAYAPIGGLAAEVDDSAEAGEEVIEVRYDVFAQVWPEAAHLRASGQLLELGKQIRCPVVAIHGEYDPHPSDGISDPLARVLADFRLVLLPHCGHEPWMERYARDEFFQLLREELREERDP
jgi:pimeloyl-ACP methyl ester carboxylesterase